MGGPAILSSTTKPISRAIVKQTMRRIGVDDKQLTPRQVLSRISWAKNHMLDPQEMYLQSADPKTERIAHIFEQYTKELERANALDFDDLLLESVRLLRASAEVRAAYNRRYRYMLIDEYQDTNRPQYELMKLLAGEAKNICVVGDEDQSIYSWRGADIRNILEFEKDFPHANIIRLEQNYRSTQVILEAAAARGGEQSAAQRKNAVDVARRRRAGWLLRSAGRRRRSAVCRRSASRNIFARPAMMKNCRASPCSTAPTRSRVWWKKALRRYGIAVHDGRRIFLLRSRRDQRPAELPEAGAESRRFRRAAAHHQYPGARHWKNYGRDAGANCAGNRNQHLGCDSIGDSREAAADANAAGARRISAA